MSTATTSAIWDLLVPRGVLAAANQGPGALSQIAVFEGFTCFALKFDSNTKHGGEKLGLANNFFLFKKKKTSSSFIGILNRN